MSDPDLDRFYSSLENYVQMVTRGYKRLFVLDAAGGLGKTYNVKRVLAEELDDSDWTHQRGFTTPVELYKTLYQAREDGHVLFLDDMSGLRSNQKAVDMLKAATETDGDENWIQYRTSQAIEHPEVPGEALRNTFCFRGSIVMSFNDTPNTNDFEALTDRGIYYNFTLDYDERIDLIREAAKLSNFSPLPVSQQRDTADWIATTTNPAMDVTLRTFEQVCQMRHFGQREGENWKEMALDVFNLDHEKHLIIRLRQRDDLSAGEQIEQFKEETGRSQGHYYNLLEEIKDERMQ